MPLENTMGMATWVLRSVVASTVTHRSPLENVWRNLETLSFSRILLLSVLLSFETFIQDINKKKLLNIKRDKNKDKSDENKKITKGNN